MGNRDLASQVILDAEHRLRQLVGEAASCGEYDAAILISRWASSLREILGSGVEERSSSPTQPAVHANKKPRKPARKRSASQRIVVDVEYPRFCRAGNYMVKIGWSNSQRDTYEHKAPRQAADSLIAVLEQRDDDCGVVTADELFPLKDPRDGSDIPGYQGYVVLAWLKSMGLVSQLGRKGYSVASPDKLRDKINKAWNELPAKH